MTNTQKKAFNEAMDGIKEIKAKLQKKEVQNLEVLKALKIELITLRVSFCFNNLFNDNLEVKKSNDEIIKGINEIMPKLDKEIKRKEALEAQEKKELKDDNNRGINKKN